MIKRSLCMSRAEQPRLEIATQRLHCGRRSCMGFSGCSTGKGGGSRCAFGRLWCGGSHSDGRLPRVSTPRRLAGADCRNRHLALYCLRSLPFIFGGHAKPFRSKRFSLLPGCLLLVGKQCARHAGPPKFLVAHEIPAGPPKSLPLPAPRFQQTPEQAA
jgi:hypothetical protein